ncbi:hypothetical protein SAY87_000082 [Trapa incisa]|uniref:FLZ-type domain-containing protein n=2 Tax=Trapa TaxID=22665 RepID=A0AAN7M916_TRANT|nr:hypothetical protein SAY87_000082 [Trapa incisa]KAK4801540.1 hypothetical protein SAY86_022027 [Trapa natans]
MLLGKRQRPPMKRTTSLSEITFDLDAGPANAQPSDPRLPVGPGYVAPPNGWDQHLLAAASPRVSRRHSADFLETPSFLRSCSLCKRRLIPGRDIYMYRGDSAFCSLECRQRQMNHDERKDKCSVAASKRMESVSPSIASVACPEVVATGETVTGRVTSLRLP